VFIWFGVNAPKLWRAHYLMRVIVLALTLVIGVATLTLAQEAFVPSFDREGQVGATPKKRATPQKRAVTTAGAPSHQSSLTPSASANDAYRMGPQDVVEISVFNVPELSKTLQLAASGAINFPLLGEIPAAGRTREELERDLTERLGAEYIQNPVVTVFIKEYNSQKVTLSGMVKSPGIYPIRSQTSLLQVIAMGGGFQETSDSNVLVMRQEGGKRTAARFDVSAIEKGEVNDPTLQGGDIVVAGTSVIKQTWGRFLKALPVAGAFAMF
jgi:polysaccharide export outer membrane protein